MILAGCSLTSSVKPQASAKAIEEVSDYIKEEACKIEPEFLKPCRWLVMPEKFDETSILLNYKINSEIYSECYVPHNKFVEAYKNDDKQE
jgi:hypothetical protein